MLKLGVPTLPGELYGLTAQDAAERLAEHLKQPALRALKMTPVALGVSKTWCTRARALNTPRRIHSRPIWSSGLWQNTTSINQSQRKRLSRLAIRTFWADCLWRQPWRKFDSSEECLEADYCFACGMVWPVPTDRSHIVSRVWGGQDELANIHLLCPLCHEISELYQGMSYWRWLRRQNQREAIRWGMSQMLWIAGFDAESVTLDYGPALILATAYLHHVRRGRNHQGPFISKDEIDHMTSGPRLPFSISC